MAEGWLRHFTGDRATVYSAGVNPHSVNAHAVEVMAEAGVDISRHTSDHVDAYLDKNIDIVLTVCDNAKELCPVFPKTTKTLHHAFDDPSCTVGTDEKILSEFRRVRDEIREYCREFVAKEAGNSG